jgi:hypothetical protein
MRQPPEEAELYVPTVVEVELDGKWLDADEAVARLSTTIHVITAWNPRAARPSREQNDLASQKLKQELESMGLRPLRALGSDPNSNHFEESWAVSGLSDREARNLGKRCGQVAIFQCTAERQTVLGCEANWQVGRPYLKPTIGDLELGHRRFDGSGRRNWERLFEKTGGRMDPTSREHGEALLKFLNDYGCRIKKSEHLRNSIFLAEFLGWWMEQERHLGGIRDKRLSELSDNDLDYVAGAFEDLAVRQADSRRSIGSTAASKVLMAISPTGFPAWDRTISLRLYVDRGRLGYKTHLRTCRGWAIRLEQEIEASKQVSSSQVGQAKLIDEWLYESLTRS